MNFDVCLKLCARLGACLLLQSWLQCCWNDFLLCFSLSVTMPTPSPLLAGASLSLSCEINSEGFKHDPPTIRWFGPDNKSYPGYLQRNKQYLNVNNVSSIHNGKWTCQLKYGIHKKITFNAMTNAIIVGEYRIKGTHHHHFLKLIHTFLHVNSFGTDKTWDGQKYVDTQASCV